MGGIFQSDCCHHIAPITKRISQMPKWRRLLCVASPRQAATARRMLAAVNSQKTGVAQLGADRKASTSCRGLGRMRISFRSFNGTKEAVG